VEWIYLSAKKESNNNIHFLGPTPMEELTLIPKSEYSTHSVSSLLRVLLVLYPLLFAEPGM
jgi:hypothetical protein